MSAKAYEIVVNGTLDPSLVAAIEGFSVVRIDHGLTHLVGLVPDQARLLGVLEDLRDLTIPLVSVNPVAPDGAGSSDEEGSSDD